MKPYQKKYRGMVKECRSRGVKVRHVGIRVLHDYGGMNDEAAKKMGFKEKGKRLKDKTILIDRNSSYRTKCRDLRHEEVEMNLMEKRHWPYWKAHKAALRAERRV